MGESNDFGYIKNHLNHHHKHHHYHHHYNKRDDDRIDSDARSVDSVASSSSSSMKISYSVNSQSEYGFALCSAQKAGKELSHVQQMRLKFENIESEFKYRPPPRFIPEIVPKSKRDSGKDQTDMSQEDGEVPSEDEVDDFGESEEVGTENGVDQADLDEPPQSPSKFRVELEIPEISVDEVYTKDDSNYVHTSGADSSYLHDSGVHTLRGGGIGFRYGTVLFLFIKCLH